MAARAPHDRPLPIPQDARRAIADQLRCQAAAGSWSLPDLQRQYAYDQLVERLCRTDDRWVVKGATALLARRVSVRHTLDIDVYLPGAIADVQRRLRRAAGLDIDDWMSFEIGPAIAMTARGTQGARAKVRSRVGTQVWASFGIDLVADPVTMTGTPDPVPPLTTVNISEQDRTSWQAYPLVDHIADKICAMLESHAGRPSTRYKDLIDLVAITGRAVVRSGPAKRAVASEAARRHLALPTSFTVPDARAWHAGYRAEARRTVGLDAVDLQAALAVVSPFVNPLLDGTATGSWAPARHVWARP